MSYNPLAYATLAELLALDPAFFKTLGSVSTGLLDVAATAVAGDTFTVGPAQLTAVNGARTPAGNDWSADGTTVAQAASLLAAILDAGNTTAGVITAEAVTPTALTVSSVATGPVSELAWSASNPASLVLTALANLAGGSEFLLNILTMAATTVDGTYWLGKTHDGHLHLAAHMATVAAGPSAGSGEGGIVSSRSMGGLSVSWAVPAFDADSGSYSATRWGRMYWMLRSGVYVPGIVGQGLVARSW